MTEHEMLNVICKKIWYEYWDWTKPYFYNMHLFPIEKDVREIIFTPWFFEKYKDYFYNFYKDKYSQIWLNLKWNDFKLGFFNYLDKPVEYIYNLIK